MAMLVMPLELFRERDDHNDMSLQRKKTMAYVSILHFPWQ